MIKKQIPEAKTNIYFKFDKIQDYSRDQMSIFLSNNLHNEYQQSYINKDI